MFGWMRWAFMDRMKIHRSAIPSLSLCRLYCWNCDLKAASRFRYRAGKMTTSSRFGRGKCLSKNELLQFATLPGLCSECVE